MQHTHRLVHLARHMLIDLPEGRFLLDTGSPVTFGSSGTATYGGVPHPIPRSAEVGGAVMSVDSLAGLDLDARIGQRLRGVLGMDLIGRATVLWDGPRGRAIVRPDAAMPTDAVRIPVEFRASAPIVGAVIGGRAAACLFASGCAFGFLPDAAFGAGGAAEDPIEHFDPRCGAIRGDSWRIPVEVQGVRFRERFILHPTLVERAVAPIGADALLGCSWMPTRRVWFNAAERAMWVASG